MPTNTPMTQDYIEFDKWDQTFYREQHLVTKKWRCTAKSKSTQTQCRRWCQLGYDICKFHGQKAVAGNLVHGKVSRYAVGVLKDSVEEFLNNTELKSLTHEIALLKALLTKYLERITSHPNLINVHSSDHVLKLVDGIRRSVETCCRLEDGLHVKIDVLQVEKLAMYVIHEMREVITQEVGPEQASKMNILLQDRISNAKIVPGIN